MVRIDALTLSLCPATRWPLTLWIKPLAELRQDLYGFVRTVFHNSTEFTHAVHTHGERISKGFAFSLAQQDLLVLQEGCQIPACTKRIVRRDCSTGTSKKRSL